ncbi:MAG: hypothetical protein COV26_01435 [Candidatus Nealsonbacteria bacterium CG10_big_fil_rev_8_21_14_0_10_36_23]|uniref:Type IV secretion system protein n=1 Tax=Candidatus Nealsonbacteria bacterium CG10_big_fil_rev_8_21_14_0_10_36_23 TaxID=1974709 RepID=A0A2H0TL67_9BACT|nr:MAG: hypothetical protein COV26_01435 [Candidatus Nealsonbacteria bacterium CG10_big_fil_rev_8_21_14_0_10_36_23]
MKNLLKKILLVLSSVFIVLSSSLALPAAAHAQSTWYNQPFPEWYLKVYDENSSPPNEIFGERYTAAQVQWVVYSLISLPLNFVGKDNQQIITCFLTSVAGGNAITPECVTSAVTSVGKIFDLLWPGSNLVSESNRSNSFLSSIFETQNRPISGIRYVKEKISRSFSIPIAKAQGGFGFNAINSIQKYWVGFRNMAYAIAVLVTIVFAFMIMFRVKLNPQTVVSIQSALPKIVVAIILATFSYAIAGFVIDLTYVVAGLFATLLYSSGFAIPGKDLYGIYEQIVPNTTLLGNFYILGYMLWYWILFALAIIVSFVATFTQLSVWGMLASIIMILVWVWLLVLCLWYTVKIPFVLIKNLISIYISIVTAPVQITFGALIPQIGFGQWFKKLVAELMVYPVTGLLLYLALSTLLSSFAVNFRVFGQFFGTDPGKLWSPSIIGSTADMSGLLWMVMSFGIIVLIPKVIELLKSMIMGEKFSFGTAIGEAQAPLQAVWRATGAPVAAYAGRNISSSVLMGLSQRIQKTDWYKRQRETNLINRIVSNLGQGRITGV